MGVRVTSSRERSSASLRALLREDVTRATPADAGRAAQTSSARGLMRRVSTAIGFSVGWPK
jgi:hypothetical protein